MHNTVVAMKGQSASQSSGATASPMAKSVRTRPMANKWWELSSEKVDLFWQF
jgi:hypothetical protein